MLITFNDTSSLSEFNRNVATAILKEGYQPVFSQVTNDFVRDEEDMIKSIDDDGNVRYFSLAEIGALIWEQNLTTDQKQSKEPSKRECLKTPLTSSAQGTKCAQLSERPEVLSTIWESQPLEKEDQSDSCNATENFRLPKVRSDAPKSLKIITWVIWALTGVGSAVYTILQALGVVSL